MIKFGLELVLVLLILGASKVLGFWAFLVLFGGVLSYLGDQLGTYFGKKRLSLFGIRPKHTAVIVSMVTGTLITLVTLIAAGLISSDYREALLTVKQKKEERERLTQENASLQMKSREQAKTLSDTNAQLRKQEEALKEADRTRQDLAREIEGLKQDKDEKLNQLKTLARAFKTKESGSIAVIKGAPLLKTPVLVALDVGRAQVKVNLVAMLAQIRQNVEPFGVEVPPQDPDKVDRDLVEPIHGQIAQMARAFKDGADGPVPVHAFIRPLSLKNLSYGEKLSSVHFEVKPNRVVFRKGEQIAHTPVDGRLPPEKILQQLFNFDRRVQEEMQKKGVLEEALQQRLGRVSAELLLQFVKIVQLVKELDRWVTVRLVAENDILAFGEICATYQVRELVSRPGSSPSASPGP